MCRVIYNANSPSLDGRGQGRVIIDLKCQWLFHPHRTSPIKGEGFLIKEHNNDNRT